MVNNYQASFNSGELSRKMDGRTDLGVYRNGCRSLQNFYVMPQGGVERRTGTEFVDETNTLNGVATFNGVDKVITSSVTDYDYKTISVTAKIRSSGGLSTDFGTLWGFGAACRVVIPLSDSLFLC